MLNVPKCNLYVNEYQANFLLILAYRTNEGKPWVLPVVRKAELALSQDESLNHEYLGQLGLDKFSELATNMLLGENSAAVKENRVRLTNLWFT